MLDTNKGTRNGWQGGVTHLDVSYYRLYVARIFRANKAGNLTGNADRRSRRRTRTISSRSGRHLATLDTSNKRLGLDQSYPKAIVKGSIPSGIMLG